MGFLYNCLQCILHLTHNPALYNYYSLVLHMCHLLRNLSQHRSYSPIPCSSRPHRSPIQYKPTAEYSGYLHSFPRYILRFPRNQTPYNFYNPARHRCHLHRNLSQHISYSPNLYSSRLHHNPNLYMSMGEYPVYSFRSPVKNSSLYIDHFDILDTMNSPFPFRKAFQNKMTSIHCLMIQNKGPRPHAYIQNHSFQPVSHQCQSVLIAISTHILSAVMMAHQLDKHIHTLHS